MKKRAKPLISVIFVFVALFLFLTIDTSHAFLGKGIFYLPYTISSPGTYYVMKDLKCPPGSHGITIRADNVTLDLMGFSLKGAGGTGDYDGVHIKNRKNVEIRNGTIRNFPRCGIWDEQDSQTVMATHRIINVRVQENGGSGIYLPSAGHFVHQCKVLGNGSDGIIAFSGSTVSSIISCGNDRFGIYVANSTVTGSTCYNNESGIVGSGNCTISGNTCYQNKQNGIETAFGATITGNNCSENLKDGIVVSGGSCTLIGNTCHNNTEYGIHLGASGACLLDQNLSAMNYSGNISGGGGATYGTNQGIP